MRFATLTFGRGTAALFIAVVLCGFGLGYHCHRQRQLEKQIDATRARWRALQATLQQSPDPLTTVSPLLADLPTAAEERRAFSETVRLLEALTGKCHVTLSEIKPLRPVISDNGVKQLVSVTLEGDYGSVIEFLRRFEDNSAGTTGHRLGLWIEALTVTQPTDARHDVVAQLEIARLATKPLNLGKPAEVPTDTAVRGAVQTPARTAARPSALPNEQS